MSSKSSFRSKERNFTLTPRLEISELEVELEVVVLGKNAGRKESSFPNLHTLCKFVERFHHPLVSMKKAFSICLGGCRSFSSSRLCSSGNYLEYLTNDEQLRSDFVDQFPSLVELNSNLDVLTEHGKDYFKELIEYNVPHGKFIRGLTFIRSFLMLTKGQELTKEEMNQVFGLGWCIEWLQSMFLVADDIMDRSSMRRGSPCWYLLPHVQENALNDAFILESQVYSMVDHLYSSEQHKKEKLKDFFRDISFKTNVGQLEDLRFNQYREHEEIDFTNYTEDIYHFIVTHKTAYYTTYMPFGMAMIASDLSEALSPEIKTISLKIGEYFQVQDDVLDCFGDPSVIGKVGRDIEEAKCSWLVVSCLSKCDEEQKQILTNNYGKEEPEKVAKVKEIYQELNLLEDFREYETRTVQEIKEKMHQLQNETYVDMFMLLLSKLENRRF